MCQRVAASPDFTEMYSELKRIVDCVTRVQSDSVGYLRITATYFPWVEPQSLEEERPA